MIGADVQPELWRTFRAALEGGADGPSARERMIESGWLDALAEVPTEAIKLAFAAQGVAARDAALLDDVVVGVLVRDWSDLAATDVAVAYPRPELALTDSERPATTRRLLLGAHRRASAFVVPSQPHDGEVRLTVVEPDDAPWREPVVGFDRELELFALRVDDLYGEASREGPSTTAIWRDAVAHARIALSHQMAASCMVLVGLARDYALQRKQFGQVIGVHQAVRHRLASTLADVVGAQAAVDAAALDVTSLSAAVAKLLAGRAAAVAARNCLQVFGAIGFTEEHPYHRYYRRNTLSDALLDSHRQLAAQVGRTLRESGTAPSFVQLDAVVPDPFPVDLLAAG